MNVTVYGAGAIGGVIGACMARGGEDALLVDKVTEHVDAMNARGLRISGVQSFTVPVRACVPADLRGPLGITFLAVKSQDTEAALDVALELKGKSRSQFRCRHNQLRPRLARQCSDVAVLQRQNLDLPKRIATRGQLQIVLSALLICRIGSSVKNLHLLLPRRNNALRLGRGLSVRPSRR